jgi:hypothetical protein
MDKADKIKKKLVLSMIRGRETSENAKYGAFIKQTNEVHFFLAHVSLLRSSFIDNDYRNWLVEKAGLGTLINIFRASANKTASMYSLFLQLQEYKKSRDRLAHKMFSAKKLTPTECEAALTLGKKILKRLYVLGKIPKRLR